MCSYIQEELVIKTKFINNICILAFAKTPQHSRKVALYNVDEPFLKRLKQLKRT